MSELESDSPAPGGGSASALVGSISASLGLMVTRLTENKKGYENAQKEVKSIERDLSEIKSDLNEAIQGDIEAFNEIGESRKLSKVTEEDKARRKEAMEAAMKNAIRSPWKIALLCQRALRLNFRILSIGNKNACTDAAAGIYISYAGIESALLNVKINLKYLPRNSYSESQYMKIKFFMEDSKNFYNLGNKLIDKILTGDVA
jgi:formiminotetrahydrofolate cyclodeaminase